MSLDWLLPPRCGGCGALGAWLCGPCRERIRPLEEPLCPRCGRELESYRPGCGCQARLRALARLRSAAAYEGPLERALHRFKYGGWRALAPTLATVMVERLPRPTWTTEPPCVVAVPLHRRRQRERGYNQSALLAWELRRRWTLPLAAGRLVRLRDTPPQVGLDRPSRRQNVAEAFGWEGARLAGAPILLVDDVATTGSTLEACGQALKTSGAGRIEGVTVARVSV